MTDGTIVLPIRTGRANAGPAAPRRRRRVRGSRARHVAVQPHTRALRAAFLRWAMFTGCPVDADAAAVATAVLDPSGEDPIVFTDDVLTELLWIDASRWCDDHAVELPPGFANTLHAFIDYCAEAGLLGPGSDTLDHLHAAVQEAGAPAPRRGCRPLPTA